MYVYYIILLIVKETIELFNDKKYISLLIGLSVSYNELICKYSLNIMSILSYSIYVFIYIMFR